MPATAKERSCAAGTFIGSSRHQMTTGNTASTTSSRYQTSGSAESEIIRPKMAVKPQTKTVRCINACAGPGGSGVVFTKCARR